MSIYDKFKQPDSGEPRRLVPLPTTGNSPYGERALENELTILARTTEGSRNDQLNRTMFAVSQLVAAGHVNGQAAWDAIETTARHIGLEEQEIRATMRSGYQAGFNQPRTVPDMNEAPAATVLPTTGDGITGEPEPAQAPPTVVDDVTSPEDKIRARYPLVDLPAIWDTEDDTEWLLYPLLPARRASVIYSAPKVGKSLLALEIAAALATGRNVLNTTPDQPLRVLYVDYENDPRGDTVERLKAMGYHADELDNLMILSYPVLAGLDTRQGAATFIDIVNTYEPTLVILDTMSRAIDGEENENDTYLNFYRNIQLPLKKAGIALLRLDHTGKDETKGQRGGSAKSGDVDMIWHYQKVSEITFRLQLDANRLPVQDQVLMLRREVAPLRHVVVGADQARQDRIDEINQLLDAAGHDNHVGERTARDTLKVLGKSAANDLLRDVLKQRKQRPFGLKLAPNGDIA
ncbi:AAA family ATPase [Trueperella pyogenes]|uniref:AAA family ATPase n=1 Tax=Trueperella pyogenes TaxID=1661 RepID=UPI003253DC8D